MMFRDDVTNKLIADEEIDTMCHFMFEPCVPSTNIMTPHQFGMFDRLCKMGGGAGPAIEGYRGVVKGAIDGPPRAASPQQLQNLVPEAAERAGRTVGTVTSKHWQRYEGRDAQKERNYNEHNQRSG